MRLCRRVHKVKRRQQIDALHYDYMTVVAQHVQRQFGCGPREIRING